MRSNVPPSREEAEECGAQASPTRRSTPPLAAILSTQRVIFVSAVTNEFHRCPPAQRDRFLSYRDVLKEGFRTLAPQYEVIVQEDLAQGMGDLLETLDHEVARSLMVVHLVGELAGLRPSPASLRTLHARHPSFLATAPELGAALGDETDVSYTQWEAYFAFHHQRRCLVFEALPEAPRSPLSTPNADELASQQRHRRRLALAGAHRGSFADQGDVARKTMRSFLHFRVDAALDCAEVTEDARDQAWAQREKIVEELAAAIKKPDPRAVPVTDPANVAAFVAAVRSAAARWRINLATVVDIAARYEEKVRAAAELRPTPDTLYEQALAELALGDFTAAQHSARRAANMALRLQQESPEDAEFHRTAAVNGLLLVHTAATAAQAIPESIAALEGAGALVDRKKHPLLWADIHEPLAEALLGRADYDRVENLVGDILDIREELQEEHTDLAGTLLLWSRLLYAEAKYDGAQSVAARAERIFAAHVPQDLPGITSALTSQAASWQAMSRHEKAEPLFRRALEIDEQYFGSSSPHLAISLNNLATVLQATNRVPEAETAMRRAIGIFEQNYGEHPKLAAGLVNLAHLLKTTGRYAEAEPLMRRAQSILEQNLGDSHPDLAICLTNLALLLQATNRLTEAEPLMRRGLEIKEQRLDPGHPQIIISLNKLAALLQALKRPEEAAPLLERVLTILVDASIATGGQHPQLQGVVVEYALVLREMGKSQQQIQARLKQLRLGAG
jgi:tetratricopeptide (TPR) repeat protein